jgi:hypothetical protein
LQVHNLAKEWKLNPALPRSTAQSWIDPWKSEPAGCPGLPRSFDMFFNFVLVLGAEEDLDSEPDLQEEPDAKHRWERLHQAAKSEAAEAKRARGRRTPREPRSSRQPWYKRRWRAAVALASGIVVVVVAVLLLSGFLARRDSRSDGGGQPVHTPTASRSHSPNWRDEMTAVRGSPIYEQCSNRARSILTRPGRDREGKPAGPPLDPGERLVVSQRTPFWKYGYVEGDSTRKGWVQSEYLCRTTAK